MSSTGYNFRKQGHPRTLGKKIVIGCEGEKTEPIYFNAIRSSIRIPSARIRVLCDGSAPMSVVQNVVSVIADVSEFNPADGDEAWAVFDGDEHIHQDKSGWDRALALAIKHGIKVAISNPCFELWFLLHFQDQTGNLDRAEARKKLKAHVPDYEKSKNLYPEHLKERTAAAIKRALALEVTHARNAVIHYTNPSSRVHELISILLGMEDLE